MFRFFKSKAIQDNKTRNTSQKRRLFLESLEGRETMAASLAVQTYGPVANPPVALVASQTPSASSPAGVSFGSIAPTTPEMFLTPDVMNAMEEVRMGRATNQQRALVFAHNNVINKARLNGWITDAHYQAAQSDFKMLNENFAGRAARDVGGEFGVQVAKKQVFSPGTDSDYIIKVKSHDPVGDVKSMQRMYNTNVNQWLEYMMGPEQAKAYVQQQWHNTLDVDFMVDPRYVTDEQFKKIAELNNDAYKRRLAADYERVSRAPAPEVVTDAHFRDYALEMQDFIKKKQDLMAIARSSPEKLKALGPELQRLMAQEQKYIDRVEAANRVLRKQEGLPQAKVPDPEGRYVFTNTADGDLVVKYRTSETLAAQGAVRSPQNLRTTTTASFMAPVTAQQAMSELSASMVEATVKRGKTAPTGATVRNLADVGQDVGKMMAALPDAEKGRLIDSIRRQHGDAVAKKIVEGMQREYGAKATGGTALDNTLRNALSISDDVRGMGNMRRVFNESLGKVLKIVDKVGTLGDLVMIKDALVDFKNIMTYIGEALVPSRTDAEADVLFRKALNSSNSMIETGAMGLLFARVPTLGAIYGAWTLGFDGTRFILENTEIGQRLERFKDQYGDRMLAAYDTAVGQLTEFLGGTSTATTQREQLLAYETNFLRLMREGKATLREGVKGLDVLNRIRSGDLVGLDELVKFSGAKKTNGPITFTDGGMLRDTVNPAFARPMAFIGIGGSLGANTKKLSYSVTLKKYDGLLPEFKYDATASPGAFVTLSFYVTDSKGRRMDNNPAGSPYYEAYEDGTYTFHVVPGHVDEDWGPGPGNPNWSIPFNFHIRVLGASVRIGEPRPLTTADWKTEIDRLNKMTPADAGKAIQQMDAAGQDETFDNMTPLRASQILWTYSWPNLISLLDRMPADRVTDIMANFSTANRAATLDQMTAKRAGEVIKSYNLWPDRIAALDKMTAKRAADVLWTFKPIERTEFLDRMTAKRASEVIWNYGLTDRVAELDRMSAKRAADVIWNYSLTNRTVTLDAMTSKRASEVIWNYSWTDLTATLDGMTAKRASEVIWNYSWTNMIASLDRMTSKRAAEVIWNYSWTNMIASLDRMTARRAAEVVWNYSVTNRTATFDRMTAQRAAQVLSQYNSTAKADVLSRFTPARKAEVSKYL